ncbi:hypothetical protein [Mycolicibacterium thermoresistibile]
MPASRSTSALRSADVSASGGAAPTVRAVAVAVATPRVANFFERRVVFVCFAI